MVTEVKWNELNGHIPEKVARMNVVSLTSPTPDKGNQRRSRIAEVFLAMPWFPNECDEDPYCTGLAQFSADDARRLAEFFDCFCVSVPASAHQPAILDAWDYLCKNYGKFINLKLRGTPIFQALTRRWTAEQHAFLEALIAGSPARIKTLGTRNGFFEIIQGILASRAAPGVTFEPVLKVVKATPASSGWRTGPGTATPVKSGMMTKLRLV
jgi:hypothetical protein